MASYSSKRVKHLFQLAVHCAEKNPALSRFYLNEISSLCADDSLAAFSLQYCRQCFELFTVHNCRVRVLPKRRKSKKQTKDRGNEEKEENKNCHKKQGEYLRLPRKLNHIAVCCKACGKHSFYTGQARSVVTPVSRTRHTLNGTSNQSNTDTSVLSTPRNNSMDHDSTPNLPKSGKKRQRRRQKSKLKDLLLADDKQKSVSTGASPRLQDFLSSL